MTKRIRYALNGIDTHLTCFCAAGRHERQADERNKARRERGRATCGRTSASFDFAAVTRER